MPTGLTLKGGPELKARLLSVAQVSPDILGEWQDTTTRAGRAGAPARTGRGRASIHAGRLSERRADVRGAYWLIFIDRGTKAHDIRPKGLSGLARGGPGTSKALVFDVGGRTVFSRRVHKRRQAPRPFLTAAAQAAFRRHFMSELVIAAWSRKRRGKTRRFGGSKLTL